jgi:protein ImuB
MYGCLFIPDFSVQAALRMEPEDSRKQLLHSSLAILDGPANLLRAVAVNAVARSLGTEVGMTKVQLEACGGIFLRKRSQVNEDSTRAALVDCASEFSPRVQLIEEAVLLDLTGTAKLFGDAKTTAAKLSDRGKEFGFALHVAFSSNPDTALYAARGFPGITIIPAGHEAVKLAPLPIDVLPITSEMLEILDSWGIRTLGALAALPSVEIVERLGREGFHLQMLAQAKTTRTLVPVEASSEFIESFEFEEPIETLESLTFILNRLIQQACNRLRSRALATNELRLTLELEVRQRRSGNDKSKEPYERAWKLPLPVQDGRVLFRLAHLDLEAMTFSAPIKKATIQLVPVKPRFTQADLFTPAAPEAEQLEITLARIRSVVGSTDSNGIACVGSPKLLDTHKPDSFAVEPFSSLPSKRQPCCVCLPVLSLHVFRPALETSVELNGEKPNSISLGRRTLHVLAAFGPWRSSGDWWNAVWAREEWDVALKTSEGIGVYRIFHDLICKQWFVEGVLD